ncbi:hypothetical protein ACH0BU_09060 [Sphingomonas olei]
MAITRPDETDLLLPLHDGAHEQAPFAVFLQRLKRRVRADQAVLAVRAGQGEWRWLDSRIAPPPDQDHLTALRAHRVYAEEEGGYARLIRVDDPGGAAAVLVIRRAQSDFSAADGALLARLAPHLAIALRTRAALDHAATTASVVERAVSAGRIAWASFGADGRPLARSEVFAARGGSFWPIAADVAACVAERRPMVVSLRPKEAAAMLLIPLDLPRTPLATAPVALGLMALNAGPGDDAQPALLAALFGLTGSEARLAAAIAAGATLSDAAAQLGLTIETTRNYSKRLFAKTRTRGQVDLVRLIGASAARFALGSFTPPAESEEGDSRPE